MDRVSDGFYLLAEGVLDLEPKAPFADCEHCPLKAEPFVSGVGRDDAKFVIVGEAPGSTEVKTGVPFTGDSGQLLKQVLTLHGIDRNTDAFVTNTVLCRPPLKDGRDTRPKAPEIKACRDRLIHDIKTHRPDAVLALGKSAAGTLLDSKDGIRLLRVGGCKQSPFFDPPVVATFHPAAREPDKLAVMISNVGKLVACGPSHR